MVSRLYSVLTVVIPIYFSFSLELNAQGTPSVLRCAFNGTLNLYATSDPTSRIIAKVKCGDPILLINDPHGSPHVRTADGKEGFIHGANFGQWGIEEDASAIPLLRDSGPTSTHNGTRETR